MLLRDFAFSLKVTIFPTHYSHKTTAYRKSILPSNHYVFFLLQVYNLHDLHNPLKAQYCGQLKRDRSILLDDWALVQFVTNNDGSAGIGFYLEYEFI